MIGYLAEQTYLLPILAQAKLHCVAFLAPSFFIITSCDLTLAHSLSRTSKTVKIPVFSELNPQTFLRVGNPLHGGHAHPTRKSVALGYRRN
jgi:hypothetical protein